MLFFSTFGLLLATACIANAKGLKAESGNEEDVDSFYPVTNGTDAFDWQLLKEFSSDSKNVLLSPISLKIVLALLYEGASGTTEKEFQTALQFPAKKELLREKFYHILRSLKAAERKEYLLNLGTRIFLDLTVQAQQNYAAKASHYYDTDIQPTNFQNETDASRSINSWIDIITNGRIRQLVRPDDLRGAIMVIANAVYFKGSWRHQFPKNETKNAGFYLTPTQVVTVPYMSTTDKFFYVDSPELDAKFLRLPYRGRRYSLFVVLPNTKAGLPSLVRNMNVQNVMRSLHKMDEVVVDVSLPKFKFNFRASFTDFLEKYGLRQMFQNTASFPGIARGANNLLRSLSVSDVVQKSGIEIDEEGSVVYAASGVLLDNKFGNAENVFNATHPFLFFLQEEMNGSILFIGKVANPLQDEGVGSLPQFEEAANPPGE